MPFKTKKKKVAANKHRIVFDPSGSVGYQALDKEEYVESQQKSKKIEEKSTFAGRDVHLELFKILLLAGLIIGLQLALKLVNLPFLK